MEDLIKRLEQLIIDWEEPLPENYYSIHSEGLDAGYYEAAQALRELVKDYKVHRDILP